MNAPRPPEPTICPQCRTKAAETICHICKTPRPWNVSLHPALTHAQAEQVCRAIDARLTQDGRGNVRLEPAEAA